MPEGQIEDIKKNTGTAVPTEVSAQEVNPMQQPNINVNQQEVNAVAQWTNQSQAVQQANTTVQQPTTQPQDLKFTELNWWQVAQQWVNAMMGAMDYSNIKNSDAVLSQLIQWQPVDWTGIAVDNARDRYDNYKSLSWMSYKEIWDTILSWDMAKNWTSMSDLRTYNPQLWQQVRIYVNQQDELNNLNNLWTSLYQNYTDVENNKNYLKQTIQQEDENTKSIITTYSDDIIDFIKSYQTNATQLMNLSSSMLSNPTIQQYKNNILELEWKIAQIQTDIEYVWDEARQMLGSSAPESLVSAYISQQTKHLQRQLMTYNNSLLVEQGKLDSAVDDVKTKLDYYMKWMDLWTDALKALMWGTSGTGSASKKSSTTTPTEEATQDIAAEVATWLQSIYDDMLSWDFLWSFNKTELKNRYWITSAVEEWELLRRLADYIEISNEKNDLLTIKNNTTDTNYQKVLNALLNTDSWRKYFVDTISNNKDNYKWIKEFLKKYWIKEAEWKSLMKEWWVSLDNRNKVSNLMWWKSETEKKSDVTKWWEAEVKFQTWTWTNQVSTQYVNTLNATTWWTKVVWDSAKNAVKAIRNWTFNASDQTTYWFNKDDTKKYIYSKIWWACDNADDLTKLMNKLSWDANWQDNFSAALNWYWSDNETIWIKAISKIKDNPKNIKLYLNWVLWPMMDTSSNKDMITSLLKQAWVSAANIKLVLQANEE